MSVLSQCYSVIIDRGISAPGHVKEVLYGINTIYKHYICQLMSNVQLTGSKIFYSQIITHFFTHTKLCCTMHVEEVINCSDIYLRVKRVSSRLNIILLILVRGFPGSLLSYWYILLRIVYIMWCPGYPM